MPGTYKELAQQSKQFRDLLQLHQERAKADTGPESQPAELSSRPDNPSPRPDKSAPAPDKAHPDRTQNRELAKRLIKKEQKYTGAVTLATYAAYYSSAFGMSEPSSTKLPVTEGKGSQYQQVTCAATIHVFT